MTDRQERFDLKISKLKILRKQRHLHLGYLDCGFWYSFRVYFTLQG